MPSDVHFERVRYDHSDAVDLRAAMIAEVAALYTDLRDDVGIAGANAIDPRSVVLTLVGRVEGRPVAHALVRRLGQDVELKRMYVTLDQRGRGTADALLDAVEGGAGELGAARLILHTGDRQVAAVRLYERHGFTPIPVYEPYLEVPGSLCFEKVL